MWVIDSKLRLDAFIEPLGAELLGGALKGAEIAELNLSGKSVSSK